MTVKIHFPSPCFTLFERQLLFHFICMDAFKTPSPKHHKGQLAAVSKPVINPIPATNVAILNKRSVDWNFTKSPTSGLCAFDPAPDDMTGPGPQNATFSTLQNDRDTRSGFCVLYYCTSVFAFNCDNTRSKWIVSVAGKWWNDFRVWFMEACTSP